jgi:hypothetical protein
VDCTSLLHAGKNTLTVILFKPGLALQGQVLLADGRALKVQTDQTWKASATAPAGWMEAGFDDSSWSKPQVTGAPSVPAPYDGSIALIAQPAHPSAPSVPEMSSAVPPIFDFAEGARFAVRLPMQKPAPQTEYHVRYSFADPWTHAEVAAGAPTNVLVDKNGHQLNWYFGSQRDPLQPEVQRSMFANLDDLLGRYARYKSVKAVSFLEGSPYDPAFPIEIGAPGDWLSSGYGDYDIALFTKDTGIQVPGSPKDPQRFAQRYAWLKAHAYEPWLTWRCQQVKQINDRLLQHVQAARPGLLFVPMIGEWNHAPYLELAHRLSGESYHQLLRESGRDPQLYAGQPGYVSYGELFPPDRARTAGMHQQNREDFGAGRSMGLSSELPQLFGSGPGTGLFDFECFYEQGLFLPPDIDWIFKGGTFSAAAYSLGSRDFVRDRLVTSLWHWDPSYLVMAWCDSFQVMGNEENLRRFALAFRSLPVGKYTLLSGTGADRNVAIKQLQGRPVWAILNPSPWPITVELSLSPGASLQDRVTGHSLPAQAGTATVELRACDLVVVEGTPGAALTGVKVTTSPEALSYLQARVADYHQLLATAQRQSAAVAAADLAGMTAAATKLDADLQSGDLLTAWLVLEGWEGRRPYVDCRNAISPSNWRVIGPFPFLSAKPLQPDYGPEADLLAGKPPAASYPTGSGRALSWTRLQIPAQEAQAIHCYTLYGESPNSVAYAFAHLSSPVAQKVRFVLGSDDGAKVWLNGQVLEENEIARGLHLGDDVFAGNLRAGDNMLLLKVEQYVGGWDVAFRLETPDGQPVTGITYSAE